MNFRLKIIVINLFICLSSVAQTPLIDEEFESGIPSNWIATSVSISSNNACTGSTNSVVFTGSGNILITPLLHDPQELKFLYLRNNNSTDWKLNVEYAKSTLGPWINLGFADNPTDMSCLPFVADLSYFSDVYIRFVDARVGGVDERYLDNVVVTQRDFFGVLSVSLLAFTAKTIDNSVKLEWSTANEKNNSHFDIERSLDGRNFSKIGQVKGNGSTTQSFDYSFLDSNFSSKTRYYRLKQVDFDRKASFSNIISIKSDFRERNVRVFPTLVNDWITVELITSNDVELVVFDMIGRVILSKKVQNTVEERNPDSFGNGGFSVNLDLNNLTKGMYFLSVKSNLGIETFKFQKL
jgi:hypothetical protein